MSAVRKIADVAIRREPKVALIEGSPGKKFRKFVSKRQCHNLKFGKTLVTGTGKTKVIVDTIIEILNGQNHSQVKNHTIKILVCGVSDSEIDEILHRLYDKRKHLKSKMYTICSLDFRVYKFF